MDMVFKRNGVRGKYSKFTTEHQAMMKTLFDQVFKKIQYKNAQKTNEKKLADV